jgi:hypothetical protein
MVKVPNILVVITTMNYLTFTINCIKSLQDSTHIDYDILIVDGCSDDGTVNYIAKHYPHIRIRILESRYWVSVSWNVALDAFLEGDYDYVVILNNDLLFHDGWLEILLSEFNKYDNVGMVGPHTLNADGSTDSRGQIGWGDLYPPKDVHVVGPDTNVRESVPIKEWTVIGGRVTPIVNKSSYPCTIIYGACFMLSREGVKAAGWFDDKLVFSHDETDYCLKMWRAGYQVRVNTNAKVIHLGGTARKGEITHLLNRVANEYGITLVHPSVLYFQNHPPHVQREIWNTVKRQLIKEGIIVYNIHLIGG